MNLQPEINDSMRTTLINWLMDVIIDFKFHSSTLHLAVNYLDRYLSKKGIMKKYLQLLGVCCLLLASKCEEVHGCLIHDLVEICDKSYTQHEVRLMEHKILNVIKFDLVAPTTLSYLDTLLSLLKADEKITRLCQLMADVTVLKYCLLKYRPSEIAASIVYLAYDMMDQLNSEIVSRL